MFFIPVLCFRGERGSTKRGKEFRHKAEFRPAVFEMWAMDISCIYLNHLLLKCRFLVSASVLSQKLPR